MITDMNKYLTYEERMDRLRDHNDGCDDDDAFDVWDRWARQQEREDNRKLRESERFDP